MPDLGRCGEVRDEKRSDSLGGFPRVVRAMGKWTEKGSELEEMNLGLILKNTKLGAWYPHNTTTYTSR